jgi:uncharacterized RDD family membrane protein YckC
MKWFYADAGKQVGPLDEAALDDLVRAGVVRDDTLIWCEGMANWQPHAAVRGVRPPPPPAPVPPPPPAPAGGSVGFCSECGRQYPADQLEISGHSAICPACKSAASAQSISPAAPAAIAGAPGQYAEWPNRALGYLIDSAFVMVVLVALYVVAFMFFGSALGLGGTFGSNTLQGLGTMGCCCLISMVPVSTIAVGLYNKVYLVSQRGYSVGQGVMKIKIVDGQGRLLTFQTALIRLLAQAGLSIIPILGLLDLLWPLWDVQRQTLHDKAVGSFAINNPDLR